MGTEPAAVPEIPAQRLFERLRALVPRLARDAVTGEMHFSEGDGMGAAGFSMSWSRETRIAPIARSDRFRVTSSGSSGSTDTGYNDWSKVVFESATADEVVAYVVREKRR